METIKKKELLDKDEKNRASENGKYNIMIIINMLIIISLCLQNKTVLVVDSTLEFDFIIMSAVLFIYLFSSFFFFYVIHFSHTYDLSRFIWIRKSFFFLELKFFFSIKK